MSNRKLFDVSQKIVVVTGSAQGNGKVIADCFSDLGAIVCYADIQSDIKVKNDKCCSYTLDVSSLGQIDNFYNWILDKYGKVDVLINNAGVTLAATDDIREDIDRWDITHKTNTRGAYYLSVLISGLMSKGSSIINITSIGSMLGFPSNPGYVASKGGVRMLTKALAEDLSHKQIRVNNIVPGYILTDMTRKSFNIKSQRNERINRMMIKRWGNVEDISGAAIFLASNASSYVTGIDLIIDGGWTAKGI